MSLGIERVYRSIETKPQQSGSDDDAQEHAEHQKIHSIMATTFCRLKSPKVGERPNLKNARTHEYLKISSLHSRVDAIQSTHL
jgi:hypothetical protein